MDEDDIVYIKLINGDEIFANRIGSEGNTIFLSEPMIMETIQTDGDMKYLFMSRYTQYGTLHSMALTTENIIFIHEAAPIVKNHYRISVTYAEKISDNRFNEGISEASRYLSMVIRKGSVQEEMNNIKDRILGNYDTSSTTKH